MTLIGSSDSRPVHFMGIAGAGMSALAELCARRGALVTGCDQHPAAAADLAHYGVTAVCGHDAAHLDGQRALVVSSAIPKDHPEVVRARALGIPVIRRAEALALATAGGRLVGIAGTHGKSTTTVMTTEALKGAGINATGVVGARVAAWGGNLSDGADEVFVVEADEYDRSFLALSCDVAVVTNIEADHLDIYKDLDDIRAAFTQFVSGARWIVLCADDANANALATPASAEVVRYSVEAQGAGSAEPSARLVARDVRMVGGRTHFEVVYDGISQGELSLGVPGLHNVRNALAAIGVGLSTWGAKLGPMATGLYTFVGAERRFQRLGSSAGIVVIDDYAHHPTEIAATLSAARAAYPGRRIVAAFQPHLFSRTRDFAREFASALAAADLTFLADIYPAREQPIPGVTSGLIEIAMIAAGRGPVWTGPQSTLAGFLSAAARDGDVIITIGAGDITNTGPELLELIRRRA